MKYYFPSLILRVLSLFTTQCGGSSYSEMRNLSKYLFNKSRYDPQLRPLNNQSEVIQVNFTIGIFSIEEFDISKGEVEIGTMIDMSWYDHFLTWEPSDFGDIHEFTLNSYTFWSPNLQSPHSSNYITSDGSGKHLTSADGRVFIVYVGYLRSKCTTDITKFPFDTHRCEYVIYSHHYGSSELGFLEVSLFTDGFTENENWNLEDVGIGRAPLNVGPGSYNTVRIWFTVRRRPVFILIHTLLPLWLTNFLTLFLFNLPVDSEERISSSVTIFMSAMFLVLPLSNEIPSNSIKVAMFSLMFASTICLSTLIIVWNIIVHRICKISRRTRPLPKLLLHLVNLGKKKDRSFAHVSDLNHTVHVSPDDDEHIEANNDKLDKINTKKVYDTKIDESKDISDKLRTDQCLVEITWFDVATLLDNVVGVMFFIFVTIVSIVGFLYIKYDAY